MNYKFMPMRYIVHTRGEMECVVPGQPYAVISIGTPGDAEAVLCINEHCRGVLRLWFDDADKANGLPVLLLRGADESEEMEPVRLFDSEAADRILDFWSEMRSEPAVALFYVHCHAGHSRSPAVAAALQKIESGDDAYWFAGKCPNMLVYRTILNRAFERGVYQP